MKLSNLKAAILAVVFMVLVSFQGGTDTMARLQQPKTITLTPSIENAETVMKALAKLPYEESAPIIQTIQQQAYAQLNPPAPAPDTTGKKKETPKNKKN